MVNNESMTDNYDISEIRDGHDYIAHIDRDTA